MEDTSSPPSFLPVEDSMPGNTTVETPPVNPDFALFIERSPMPDENGVINIDSGWVPVLVAELGSQGVPVTESAPSADDITAGIETARTLIADKKSIEFLENMPYRLVKPEDFGDERATILKTEGLLWIDPSVIVGTGTFDEATGWSGRGEGHGKQYTDSLGVSGVGKSIDVIEDYAARASQLPKLEYGALGIILPADGSKPIVFTTNSNHRASAAKLRGEPLGFNTVMVFDRTKKPN